MRKSSSPRAGRPWWVGFALWGLPNRASAIVCLGLLLWVAGLAVFLGFGDIRESLGVLARYMTLRQLQAGLWVLGVLASLFAFWYLRAIMWVDRNGGWPGKTPRPGEGTAAVEQPDAPGGEPPRDSVP